MPTNDSEQAAGERRYDLDRVIRLLMSVGALAATIWLLRYLSDVLIPFAVALLAAYLLNPVVNRIEARLKSRPAAVLVTVFGCIGVVSVAGIMLFPVVTTQIDDFSRMIHDLRGQVEATSPHAAPWESSGEASTLPTDTAPPESLAARFDHFIGSQSDPRARWVLERIREFLGSPEFNQLAVNFGKRVGTGLLGFLTGALNFVLGLTGLVVVLLYVVFLLNDFRLVERNWKQILPPAYREPLVKFLDEFYVAMSRYFRGQFVVAACVGVLFAVGFSVIGLRMGVLLGLFIGLLNMVPYAQTVGLVPASIFAIIRAVENQSSVLISVLVTFAVFVVVQLIQDTILTPRIVGKATGLRPAVILLGIFVWGKLLGFLGVVLAIPLTCMGLAYYRRFVLDAEPASAGDAPTPAVADGPAAS